MKLRISHKSQYDFEFPVELNPHNLFLKPLQRSHYYLDNYELDISPSPLGTNERFSIEGNPFFLVWFSGFHSSLKVNTTFEVTFLDFNPFSFIIDLDFLTRIEPNSSKIFHYKPKDEILLFPYLITESVIPLFDFANAEFQKHPDNPIGYLMGLLAEVHAQWKHIIREEENIWAPEDTYFKKEGSCRDLSWMLIHMLRMQGLGARFVSGYAFNPELDEGHELHAWVEVYLPGAGWLGIDPSLGLFADQYYVPLACSAEAYNTLPIHGRYGGTATAKLSTFVEMEVVEKKLK